MSFNSNRITINFTLINMLLKWLQHQEFINEHMTLWLMKIGLERCLLRLESNMHMLFKFLWHKQWHGVHVFHFLDIFKSFDRCDTCIKTYKFCFIAIGTSHLIMFTCFECEHCINTLLKFSLKIQV